MSHSIPAPRRPQDFDPNNPYRPLPTPGPTCASCAHRTCRDFRAQNLPRLGGHRSEFAPEHHRAALLQERHPHLLIWFGESTHSFWVASSKGMRESTTFDDLLAHLWSRAQGVSPHP